MSGYRSAPDNGLFGKLYTKKIDSQTQNMSNWSYGNALYLTFAEQNASCQFVGGDHTLQNDAHACVRR